MAGSSTWPMRLSAVGASSVTLAGIAVLLGWSVDLAALKSGPKMSALTAVSFVLCGVSMGLQLADVQSVRRPVRLSVLAWNGSAKTIGCLLIALIAAFSLAEYAYRWGFAPDSLGFEDSSSPPALMAPAIALTFLATASALFVARPPFPVMASQLLAVLIGLSGWIGVSHYLYGGAPLLPFASMAVHTASLFLILSVSILSLRVDGGLMGLASSDTRGGAIARRLIPCILIVPIVLGWLRLQGERLGWYGTEAGVSLFALGNMLIFGALVWISANRLHRSELERRKTQHQGQVDQQLLQAIADNSPAVVYAKDIDGRYLFVNRRFEDIFDLSREIILGRTDHNLFPKDIADGFRAMDLRAAASNPAIVAEETAPQTDGLHTYLSVKCRLLDRSGRAYATIGVSTDISERKSAEAALRASEERFRTLAESLPQLVWTCRSDGWCDFLSRQWTEYTGRPEAPQLGYGWAEHVHPEDRPRVNTQWMEAVRAGDIFDTEFRVRRADGIYRWFRTRAMPLRNAQGEITKWFGSNTDVEDYKRSEARLRTQLANLNLLDKTTRAIGDRQDFDSIALTVLQSMEDHLPADFGCILQHEPSRSALTVSRVGAKSLAPAQRLGLTEGSVIDIDGNGLARCMRGELVYEPDASNVNFPFPQRLAQGAGLRSFVAAPLLSENKIFGVMVIARYEPESFESVDCEFLRQLSVHIGLAAHQAQLYRALQHAYEDLRQTQQAIAQHDRLRVVGQMASGIAHDINNALSPVALYTESMLENEKGLSERARGHLRIIERAIHDVSQTVTRLREFYRPQQDGEVIGPIDVNHILQQVIDLTRVRWQDIPQERGIVIRTALEVEQQLPVITVSESSLRDALTNLVINAIDAMPEGGSLTLRSRRGPASGDGSRTSVMIEVKDTGLGMDEITRTRCLEPFFTTKGERGTGLGLAMVYGMVGRHGADIAIESAPGAGTTVRLSFEGATVPTTAVTAPPATPKPLECLRLLIVDDDPILRETLCNILEGDGHRTIVTDGGQAGIDAFRSSQARGETFDAVITDLGMPYVDGRRVAAQVKALSVDTPVILLTGWGHRLLSENDIPEYVDRVLGKPPKLAELRRTLAEVTRAHPRAQAAGS